MNFEFRELAIPEVKLITPETFTDERGFFMETYKKSVFDKAGIREDFVQDNHSSSRKNILRGLHYQIPPRDQAKLIRCIRGEIFDVVVDIRRGSPHFGEWLGEYLNEDNRKMIFVPSGFAHGYLVLSDKAEIVYKISEEYSKNHERGLLWKDPEVSIDWPLSVSPILSKKDQKLPLLKDAGEDFRYEHEQG
jgi:dTDP-4-dehydrorhamnose 3,5-epimerase